MPARTLVVLLVAAAVVLAPRAAAAEDAAALIASGDEAFRAFDNQKALAAYREALGLEPSSFEALEKVTKTLREIGLELNAKTPKDKAALRYFEESARSAEAMRQRYPDRPQTYYYLASAYGNIALFKGGGDKVRLARDIERYGKEATEVDPNYAPAYTLLGVYYREVANATGIERALAKVLFGGLPPGSNGDSVRMLTRSLELNPDDLYTTFQLGMTYAVMRQKDRAAEAFRKAAAMTPKSSADARAKADAAARLAALERR